MHYICSNDDDFSKWSTELKSHILHYIIYESSSILDQIHRVSHIRSEDDFIPRSMTCCNNRVPSTNGTYHPNVTNLFVLTKNKLHASNGLKKVISECTQITYH